MTETASKLTLGPVLFKWPPEDLRDFYFRIADEADIDSVCIGEAVCSKRASFFEPHLAEVAERLQKGGKEVVLSTLALIPSESDEDRVRDEVAGAPDDLLVEANDVATAALMAGRPHAVGPYVNVYNEGALAYLEGRGAVRVCLGAELPSASLAVLAEAAKAELEVQVFGRLPLALSARCYHARSRGLHKDNCRFVCQEDPDGMEVQTMDGDPFLAINGIQTLSYSYHCLVGELAELEDMGIARFRLSPHTADMVKVADLFRGVLAGRAEPEAVLAEMKTLSGGAPLSNGFYHDAVGRDFIEARIPE